MRGSVHQSRFGCLYCTTDNFAMICILFGVQRLFYAWGRQLAMIYVLHYKSSNIKILRQLVCTCSVTGDELKNSLIHIELIDC
jgi:hypothetical protein